MGTDCCAALVRVCLGEPVSHGVLEKGARAGPWPAKASHGCCGVFFAAFSCEDFPYEPQGSSKV